MGLWYGLMVWAYGMDLWYRLVGSLEFLSFWLPKQLQWADVWGVVWGGKLRGGRLKREPTVAGSFPRDPTCGLMHPRYLR